MVTGRDNLALQTINLRCGLLGVRGNSAFALSYVLGCSHSTTPLLILHGRQLRPRQRRRWIGGDGVIRRQDVRQQARREDVCGIRPECRFQERHQRLYKVSTVHVPKTGTANMKRSNPLPTNQNVQGRITYMSVPCCPSVFNK